MYIYRKPHLLYNRNLYRVSKIIAAQINSFSINGDTVYMKHKKLCDQSSKCTLGIIKTSLKLKSGLLAFSEWMTNKSHHVTYLMICVIKALIGFCCYINLNLNPVV